MNNPLVLGLVFLLLGLLLGGSLIAWLAWRNERAVAAARLRDTQLATEQEAVRLRDFALALQQGGPPAVATITDQRPDVIEAAEHRIAAQTIETGKRKIMELYQRAGWVISEEEALEQARRAYHNLPILPDQ